MTFNFSQFVFYNIHTTHLNRTMVLLKLCQPGKDLKLGILEVAELS